jgi:hypothetical protein
VAVPADGNTVWPSEGQLREVTVLGAYSISDGSLTLSRRVYQVFAPPTCDQ